MSYHNPVLLEETVDGLNIQPSGVYVDVTFGGGGHSREILNRLGPNGKLYAFDQDKDALENKIDDERFVLMSSLDSNRVEKPLSATSNWCDETPKSPKIPSTFLIP